MEVKKHSLPDRNSMIGGLAYDPRVNCVWLGLANSLDFVTRYDLGGNAFVAEQANAHLSGYSYIHRSLVPAPDGRLYCGVSWVLGAAPKPTKPTPLSPGGFGAVLAMVRYLGGLLSTCRILYRESDGSWHRLADGKTMSADLHWDPTRRKLLRLSAQGISGFGETGVEEMIAPTLKGFVHELCVGPGGELVQVDDEGDCFLLDASAKNKVKLGSLQDTSEDAHAAPGIDALVAVGPHLLVGGTRNRARPFVIDLRVPSLQLLPPVPTAPRASAFAVSPSGKVYFAAGVGEVGLYALDPEKSTVEAIGRIAADGVPCHHLHDLVITQDGRLFGGEFFPLDVPRPPWPDRPCYLWEMGPVPV